MAQLQQLQPSRLSCSFNRQHRPFFSAVKPVTRCRPVAAAHHQAAADQLVTQPTQIQQWLHFTPAAVLASTLTAAGSAYADEAVDAAYAAAVEGGPTDLVVTAMATFVFVLLLVVTGGVLYLNLTSWLDDRQEKKDKEAPVFTSSVSSASRDEGEARRKVKVKKEKRGFGGN